MKRRLALALIVAALPLSACDDDNPMEPTPTRIIGLSGNMNFGTVAVGSVAERTLTISNTGNSALSVSAIIVPNGYSTTFAPTTIQPGSSHPVIVRLAPTQAIEYAGVITVTGDQTSGTNTASVTGTGVPPPPVASD